MLMSPTNSRGKGFGRQPTRLRWIGAGANWVYLHSEKQWWKKFALQCRRRRA